MNLPPIMIVSIDMEYLLAFHAHNPVRVQSALLTPSIMYFQFTPKGRILLSLERGQFAILVLMWGIYSPVPRTTTSYSGAISSMLK